MKIAVLGLGLMGQAIMQRLQASDHVLIGWNRSPQPVREAQALGLPATRDLTAAASADCLLLVLSDAAAIDQTLSSPALGALDGRTVIQMGTIAPAESRAFETRVQHAGGRYLEAPVLGSLPEARNGTLIIMAGGDRAVFEHCLPLLRLLGSDPQRIGPAGKGAALKLAMNQLIAGLTAAFSASLGLVRAEGIDVDSFMDLLRGSALYAPTFDKKLARMLDHDYANPNFPLKHLVKDTRLFAAAAAACGQDTQIVETLARVFAAGADAGHADMDYSALYEAINTGAR